MDSDSHLFEPHPALRPRGRQRAMITALLVAVWAMPGPAQQPAKDDLTQINLEQLLNIQVTSVSKKEQKLSNAAAAVFVITQEDIRRSAAQNVPDLLRMVPGVDVAQIDANVWAVTIRGFNSRYSNKVLVLVDGRSVYTPTFSGVYWDQLEMPLEDIDRIEVIRGPGGTVWGANAVNGVINIITKPAKAAKGGFATASVSSDGESHNVMRYGGAAGSTGNYRASLSFSRLSGGAFANGVPGDDTWSNARGSFRSDFEFSKQDLLTVEGDLFSNRGDQVRHVSYYPTASDIPQPGRFAGAGGDLLANWSHTLANGSEMALQAYYDTYRRDDHASPEFQRTVDLRLDHHIPTSGRHDITWGAGYRMAYSGVGRGFAIQLSPRVRADQLMSAFVQDEIQIGTGLWLTIGSKIEHNDYTGFEYEPNARLVWTPNTRHTLWAAASRGIRQPNREEFSVQLDLISSSPGPGMMLVSTLQGNRHQRSEEIRDYELGYRAQLTRRLSTDVTSFFSAYRNLSTFESQPLIYRPNPDGTLTVQAPVIYGNKAGGRTYGNEASLNWQVTPFWRVSPGYALLHVEIKPDPSCTDATATLVAGNTPRATFNVRSLVNLGRRLQWDQALYWVDSISGGTVAAYTRVDSRLTWRLRESTEVSIAGRNLLRPGVFQYSDTFDLMGSAAKRSVFGNITWRF